MCFSETGKSGTPPGPAENKHYPPRGRGDTRRKREREGRAGDEGMEGWDAALGIEALMEFQQQSYRVTRHEELKTFRGP